MCVCVFVVSTRDYFSPGPISKNVRKKLVEGSNKEEEEEVFWGEGYYKFFLKNVRHCNGGGGSGY